MSDHHCNRFKRHSVISQIILWRNVVPCPPKDTISDPFVLSYIVSAVEVGCHAGIKPPPWAVVRPAVPRQVPVVVPVRGGERPVVVVVVLVEPQGVARGPPSSPLRTGGSAAARWPPWTARTLRTLSPPRSPPAPPAAPCPWPASGSVSSRCPAQNSPPLISPNPSRYSAHVRLKLTLPSWRRWMTVQPPPWCSMSHNAGKGLYLGSGATMWRPLLWCPLWR